jgi:hypothetical protein
MLAYIVRSVTAFAIKAKARALAITVSDAPTVSTQASPIAPRPSLRLLDASSCPTLPVRQSHSLPQHPRDAGVCRLRNDPPLRGQWPPRVGRLRNDPPLRGQWPPRVGSLALRRPCGRLVLGRRPLSCSPSHIPRGSNGGDQLTGEQEKRGFPPFSSSPAFFFPPTFSCYVRSQAQCLSQPTRSRNEADRLFYTHSPAGSRQPSINLFLLLIANR